MKQKAFAASREIDPCRLARQGAKSQREASDEAETLRVFAALREVIIFPCSNGSSRRHSTLALFLRLAPAENHASLLSSKRRSTDMNLYQTEFFDAQANG